MNLVFEYTSEDQRELAKIAHVKDSGLGKSGDVFDQPKTSNRGRNVARAVVAAFILAVVWSRNMQHRSSTAGTPQHAPSLDLTVAAFVIILTAVLLLFWLIGLFFPGESARRRKLKTHGLISIDIEPDRLALVFRSQRNALEMGSVR